MFQGLLGWLFGSWGAERGPTTSPPYHGTANWSPTAYRGVASVAAPTRHGTARVAAFARHGTATVTK